MHPELEERGREKRHRRLAVIFGLLLALLVHLFVFWGPRIHYRPLLEDAKITRVIRAKPLRQETPAPRVEPAPATPTPPPTGPQPTPSAEAPAGAVGEASSEPAPAAPPPAGEAHDTEAAAPGPARQVDAAARQSGAPGPGEWESLLAEMESKGRGGSGKKWDVAQGGGGGGGSGSGGGGGGRGGTGQGGGGTGDGDAYLDPRIRMNVVSYPPTSIEKRFTPVPFPDVRVTRRQFTEGICRVYYRVRTDESGKIVRREFKTPATEEARKHFAPFVDAVVRTVESWTFEREAADIHVDVYFDLANL